MRSDPKKGEKMNWKEDVRREFEKIVVSNVLLGERVDVRVRILTPAEAIGSPKDQDYPIIKGRERMIEAEFKGAKGHAFADKFKNFSGSLEAVLKLDLGSTDNRAIFISSLNAVLRHLGLSDHTVHCRNEEPVQCAMQTRDYFIEHFGAGKKIALVGYQPRFAQYLSNDFELRVTDLDADNIGKKKGEFVIESGEKNKEVAEWADIIFVTGTVFISDGADIFLQNRGKTIFYGVTVAGIAALLKLKKLCYLGH